MWPEPKYFITAYKAANNVYIANVIYQVELANLDFKPSDECQELRFFSFDEMHNLKLTPNVQKLLENKRGMVATEVLERDQRVGSDLQDSSGRIGSRTATMV